MSHVVSFTLSSWPKCLQLFKVDHILIGASRSGTTTLDAYIRQHPSIEPSLIKEVIYFTVPDQYFKGTNYLSTFFKSAKTRNIISTSDTYLFINPEGAKRLYDHNPDCKISIILREPGSRAFSSYQYARNNGHDLNQPAFIESLEREQALIHSGDIIKANNLCHFYGSLYHKHIKSWESIFSREQLFISTTNALKSNPQEEMNRFFSFLNLDVFTVKKEEQKNAARKPKYMALHRLLIDRNHPLRTIIRTPLQIPFIKKIILRSGIADTLKAQNSAEKRYAPMTSEERAFCNQYFENDLKLLKEDYGIDFNSYE